MIIFLGVLAGTIVFALLFRNPLKRFPLIFYALALILGCLPFLTFWMSVPRVFQMLVLLPLQRCYLAFALFTVVMFIGVFSDESRIKAYFMPIRAELSIMACLLALPHIVRNIVTYVPKLFWDSLGVTVPMTLSVALAMLLTVLLLVLGVTSFRAIKERMHTATWKKVQRFAYVFFVLIFVHLGLMLVPSALSGGVDARQNLIIYGVIFVLYGVLRLRKAFVDKRTDTEDDLMPAQHNQERERKTSAE